MAKALLISVLIATIALPMIFARDAKPKRGLRRTVVWMVLFCVFYVFAALYVYPRL